MTHAQGALGVPLLGMTRSERAILNRAVRCLNVLARLAESGRLTGEQDAALAAQLSETCMEVLGVLNADWNRKRVRL